MTTYTFRPVPAIDPTTNTVIRNTSGQLFALADEAFTTPLSFTDLAGVAQTELRVGPFGITDSFRIVDHARVMWKSGQYVLDLWSPDAIVEAVTTAASDAAAALVQVQTLSDESVGGLATAAAEAAAEAAAAADSAAASAAVATTPRNDNGLVSDGAPADPIRFMRGTASAWDASTFVPPDGMPLLAVDEAAGTVELRIGNGADTWANLPGITGGSTGGTGGGSIVAADITDSTVLGRALLKAIDATTARTTIGVDWLLTGTGAPEGVVAAPVGALYRRTDGTTNQTHYAKEAGTGTTGWKALGGVTTAASLGLAPYVNVQPTGLPVSLAQAAYVDNVIRRFPFDGTSYPPVPTHVAAGCAAFDAEGHPDAPPPPAGGRPNAAEEDFWYPDHTVA